MAVRREASQWIPVVDVKTISFSFSGSATLCGAESPPYGNTLPVAGTCSKCGLTTPRLYAEINPNIPCCPGLLSEG